MEKRNTARFEVPWHTLWSYLNVCKRETFTIEVSDARIIFFVATPARIRTLIGFFIPHRADYDIISRWRVFCYHNDRIERDFLKKRNKTLKASSWRIKCFELIIVLFCAIILHACDFMICRNVSFETDPRRIPSNYV